MSAPFKVTAGQLSHLATFLDRLSEATRATGVRVAVYGSTDVAVDGNNLAISWDEQANAYVIDDRTGS